MENSKPVFRMLDLDRKGFEEFFNARNPEYRDLSNKGFILQVENYFFLANDKKRDKLGNNAAYIVNGQGRIAVKTGRDLGSSWSGAAVMYCDCADVSKLEKKLVGISRGVHDGVMEFELVNGIPAFMSVIMVNDEKKIGVAIPNNGKRSKAIISFPYSGDQKGYYKEACKENGIWPNGTLPYLVESDTFVRYIPLKIKQIMGLVEEKTK